MKYRENLFSVAILPLIHFENKFLLLIHIQLSYIFLNLDNSIAYVISPFWIFILTNFKKIIYVFCLNGHIYATFGYKSTNIDIKNTYVPDGTNPDTEACCEAYNTLLKNIGAADLQLLGIGPNGHIGFNEPDDHFQAGTHCVDLTEATIQANKRFFASEEDVPRKAISMGTGNIMSAKTILLVANGKNKSKALAAAIKGPVTPQCPASILQFHPNAIIVADEDALSEL